MDESPSLQGQASDVHGKGINRKDLVFASVVIITVLLLGGGSWYYFTYFNWRSSAQILAVIQKEIVPSIVMVSCADRDGGEEVQSGSGVYYTDAQGMPVVETNAHVVLSSDGQYHGCNVYFPQPSDGSFYDSAYVAGQPILFDREKSIVDGREIDGIDYAQLPLTGSVSGVPRAPFPFPPQKEDVYKIVQKLCNRPVHVLIGDPIYVIGYPGVGGSSVTLTQGVVSGAGGDSEEFIKVSAGINHGNSGGFAIGAESGCSYGMPTSATFESGSNLGYILGSGFINRFISGMTGLPTYTPPPATSAEDALLPATTYTLLGLAIQYPVEWTTSASNPVSPNDSSTQSVSLTAPLEGARDFFQETMVITVSENVPQTSFASTIAIRKEDAYYESERYMTVNGIKAFQTRTADYYSYAVPVVINQVLFWYKNNLYAIDSFSEMGSNEDAYENLFSGMVKSIRFTK